MVGEHISLLWLPDDFYLFSIRILSYTRLYRFSLALIINNYWHIKDRETTIWIQLIPASVYIPTLYPKYFSNEKTIKIHEERSYCFASPLRANIPQNFYLPPINIFGWYDNFPRDASKANIWCLTFPRKFLVFIHFLTKRPLLIVLGKRCEKSLFAWVHRRLGDCF